jgi:hypothetical protein
MRYDKALEKGWPIATGMIEACRPILAPAQSGRAHPLQSAGIEAIWPYGAGFRDSGTGTFVEQTTRLTGPEQARCHEAG